MSPQPSFLMRAESDNRLGTVHAQAPATGGDASDSNYDTTSDPFGDVELTLTADNGGGAERARAELVSSSSFVGFDDRTYAIQGLRLRSRGTVELVRPEGSKALATVSEKVGMGFRLEGLSDGAVARLRLVGSFDCEFTGPTVRFSGAGASIVVAGEDGGPRREVVLEPPDFDVELCLSKNGEYALEAKIDVEIGPGVVWADRVSAAVEASLEPVGRPVVEVG